MAERIFQTNIVPFYKRGMQIYAIALNRKQSVPLAADGQKTVARRILYDMFIKGINHTKKHSKCAGIVGTTMEKYHPHGDSSIYDVIVNMANWYSCKMPLVDPHGNFGNMCGAGAAAFRYTEARLSEFADECVLGDLYKSKDIVDWVPNFDETTVEPEYLPVKVPLLLINGTFGIGIGMRSEVPTHNITEVIDATINVLRNPKAPVVLIPDHCMGCDIVDTNWAHICNTGLGTYRARAVIDVEYEKDGNSKLIIRSVPNSVTIFVAKASKDEGVIAAINEMANKGELPEVVRCVQNTKGKDLRYEVHLRKGADPEYVKSYLYKHTLLQKTFRVNFEALIGIEGLRFSYKSYIEYFIECTLTLKTRSYAALHQAAKTEYIMYQMYINIMQKNELPAIQAEINALTDVSVEGRNRFKEYLIKKYKVTDIEADFIMSMDQMKAAIGYLPIYEEKCRKLMEQFTFYFKMMTDEDAIKEEVIEDLKAIKKKYGVPRICKVINASEENNIPEGDFKIIITESNKIKKLLPTDNINTYKGDSPKFVINASNTKNILLFNRAGVCFKLPVFKIPACDKNASGIELSLLIKNCIADIMTVMYEPTVEMLSKQSVKHFMVVLTKLNKIKKLDLEDFLNISLSGTFFTKLNEGDYVQDITIIAHGLEAVVYSDRKALRFNSSEINHYKRTSIGDAAMYTNEFIDGISVLYPGCTDCIVITTQGMVNRVSITALKMSNRNKAGVNVIKFKNDSDFIFNIYGVSESDTVQVTTKNNVIEIPVASLKQSSTASSGEKLIPLSNGDVILKAKVLVKE